MMLRTIPRIVVVDPATLPASQAGCVGTTEIGKKIQCLIDRDDRFSTVLDKLAGGGLRRVFIYPSTMDFMVADVVTEPKVDSMRNDFNIDDLSPDDAFIFYNSAMIRVATEKGVATMSEHELWHIEFFRRYPVHSSETGELLDEIAERQDGSGKTDLIIRGLEHFFLRTHAYGCGRENFVRDDIQLAMAMRMCELPEEGDWEAPHPAFMVDGYVGLMLDVVYPCRVVGWRDEYRQNVEWLKDWTRAALATFPRLVEPTLRLGKKFSRLLFKRITDKKGRPRTKGTAGRVRYVLREMDRAKRKALPRGVFLM